MGERGHYACARKPLGSGGYADVFPATHKHSGQKVAFKRLKKTIDDNAAPRMEREIRVMRKLASERHVMPVLDADPNSHWYVMPLAEGDAYKLHSSLDEVELSRLLGAAADALQAAHRLNYIHRDVTPRNLLRLGPDHWVVADWGMARATPGNTTKLLTKTGRAIGTEGFAAPEVLHGVPPHPSADIYSLGRVAAWALTGTWPLAGQRLDVTGPFRRLVREATREEPSQRLSLDQFGKRLEALRLGPKTPPVSDADALVNAGKEGRSEAWAQLFDLAEDDLEDSDLLLDHVSQAPMSAITTFVATDPDSVDEVAGAMANHLDRNWGDRRFAQLDRVLKFIWRCAVAAEKAGNLGLLEDVAIALFQAEAHAQQFEQRRQTREWLDRLRGEAALTVARALEEVPRAAGWYTDEEWKPSRNADPSIRAALAL